jgi:hypothetical protein
MSSNKKGSDTKTRRWSTPDFDVVQSDRAIALGPTLTSTATGAMPAADFPPCTKSKPGDLHITSKPPNPPYHDIQSAETEISRSHLPATPRPRPERQVGIELAAFQHRNSLLALNIN